VIETLKLHPRGNEILKRYGTVPGTDLPLFRLVWSEGRMRFLVGEFRPLYRNCREWILEEWRPPEDYGDPREWESKITDEGQSRLGPFPYNGDYEEVYRMGKIEEPNEDQLQFLAKWVRQSADMTPEQKRASRKAEQEARNRELEAALGDMIHDSWPTQREIDDYYANDFRFEKLQKRMQRQQQIAAQSSQILVVQPGQLNQFLQSRR
jgi:hypothetical protein